MINYLVIQTIMVTAPLYTCNMLLLYQLHTFLAQETVSISCILYCICKAKKIEPGCTASKLSL